MVKDVETRFSGRTALTSANFECTPLGCTAFCCLQERVCFESCSWRSALAAAATMSRAPRTGPPKINPHACPERRTQRRTITNTRLCSRDICDFANLSPGETFRVCTYLCAEPHALDLRDYRVRAIQTTKLPRAAQHQKEQVR